MKAASALPFAFPRMGLLTHTFFKKENIIATEIKIMIFFVGTYLVL